MITSRPGYEVLEYSCHEGNGAVGNALSGERAYERLCKLIDAFAKEAAQADFDAPVPAEVLRAHFARVLGEADTRAPLLTGGVSFARMVPMRLLPFRVICLLGMNDGDFPRRDPGAGLNRLTAELGSDRRRHGDRSTRDDDRYLFLQLFSSAQDVFHVSWIGADPRDGSAREPSVLVSELLDTAARYHHGDAETVREQLVVRHALQPFSPAAFGAALPQETQGDARRFSFDARWYPAAGADTGTSRAEREMFASILPPREEAAETVLSLAQLRDEFVCDGVPDCPLVVLEPPDAGAVDEAPVLVADRGQALEQVDPGRLARGGRASWWLWLAWLLLCVAAARPQQLGDAEVLQGAGEHDRGRRARQEPLLVVVGVVE